MLTPLYGPFPLLATYAATMVAVGISKSLFMVNSFGKSLVTGISEYTRLGLTTH